MTRRCGKEDQQTPARRRQIGRQTGEELGRPELGWPVIRRQKPSVQHPRRDDEGRQPTGYGSGIWRELVANSNRQVESDRRDPDRHGRPGEVGPTHDRGEQDRAESPCARVVTDKEENGGQNQQNRPAVRPKTARRGRPHLGRQRRRRGEDESPAVTEERRRQCDRRPRSKTAMSRAASRSCIRRSSR